MPSICECIRYQYAQSFNNITTAFSCRKSVPCCERMKRITMGLLQFFCIPVQGCSKRVKLADDHDVVLLDPQIIEVKRATKTSRRQTRPIVIVACALCLVALPVLFDRFVLNKPFGGYLRVMPNWPGCVLTWCVYKLAQGTIKKIKHQLSEQKREVKVSALEKQRIEEKSLSDLADQSQESQRSLEEYREKLKQAKQQLKIAQDEASSAKEQARQHQAEVENHRQSKGVEDIVPDTNEDDTIESQELSETEIELAATLVQLARITKEGNSFELYTRAAELRNPEAQFQLGAFFYFIKKDKAKDQFKLAASNGNTNALIIMGKYGDNFDKIDKKELLKMIQLPPIDSVDPKDSKSVGKYFQGIYRKNFSMHKNNKTLPEHHRISSSIGNINIGDLGDKKDNGKK